MSKAIKLKEPSVVRTYDRDGFRKRAACICVNDDESKVLLVTSRKDNSQWIVPGGGVEPDESEATAALREVKEEAGVSGTLGRCLGVFENSERGHRTSVFVMEVTEELDDWDENRTFGRQRQWFTIEAAVGVLHKPLQSNYVKLLLPPDHRYHIEPPHPHVAPRFPHPSYYESDSSPSVGKAQCRQGSSSVDSGGADLSSSVITNPDSVSSSSLTAIPALATSHTSSLSAASNVTSEQCTASRHSSTSPCTAEGDDHPSLGDVVDGAVKTALPPDEGIALVDGSLVDKLSSVPPAELERVSDPSSSVLQNDSSQVDSCSKYDISDNDSTHGTDAACRPSSPPSNKDCSNSSSPSRSDCSQSYHTAVEERTADE